MNNYDNLPKRDSKEFEEQKVFDYLLESSEEFNTKNISKKSVLTIIRNLIFSFGERVLCSILIICGFLCVFEILHMFLNAFVEVLLEASLNDSVEWSNIKILDFKEMFIYAFIVPILLGIYRWAKNYLKKKSRTEIIKDILKSLDILQAFYLISIAASLLLTLGIVCCLIYIENIEIIRKITVSSAGSDIIKFLFYLMIPIFVIEVVIRIIQVFAKNEKLESRCLKNMIHEWNKADDVSLSDRERNNS